MEFKRISLNLIAYFQDHRHLSRICIKDDIQTIRDLEKYIVKVFNIEKGFYLICKNCFLPSTENIQLLDDNDLIYVMPNYQTESQECNVKKMKYKSSTSTEKLDVAEAPKPKKNKSTNNYNINVVENKNREVEVDKTKISSEKVKKSESKKNVENNIKNIEMVIDKSNKNDEQSKEVINMEVNETEISSNGPTEICDDGELYIRKRRRCITPIKSMNKRVSASEIFSLEKHFKSVEGLMHEIEIDKISNEKELENKKIESIPNIVPSLEVVKKDEQLIYEEQINKSSENRKSYSLNEVIEFPCNKTPTKFPNNRKQSFKQYKQYSGIGSILKLISADNSVHEESDDTVQSEKDFITKRRRVRTRRSGRKNKTDTSANESPCDSPVFKPPKTIAAPKSHIKFTNDEIESSLIHSTPKFINNNENTENTNLSLNIYENKLSLVNVNQLNCIELTGIPSVNSVIMFKKLTIGENYTPKISNYILGKVTNVTKNGQINVHILDGHDELKEPTGRFSCISDEAEQTEDNLDSIILERNALIEAKLVKEITV